MPDIEYHAFRPPGSRHAFIRHIVIRIVGLSDETGSAERSIEDSLAKMDELLCTLPHLESVVLESRDGPKKNSISPETFSHTIRTNLQQRSWKAGWETARADERGELSEPERVPVSPVWRLDRYARVRATNT